MIRKMNIFDRTIKTSKLTLFYAIDPKTEGNQVNYREIRKEICIFECCINVSVRM